MLAFINLIKSRCMLAFINLIKVDVCWHLFLRYTNIQFHSEFGHFDKRYDQTILGKVWSDDIEKGMIRRYWEWQLQYQSRSPKEIGGVHYTVLPFVLHYFADSNSFARILFCLTGLGFLAIILYFSIVRLSLNRHQLI